MTDPKQRALDAVRQLSREANAVRDRAISIAFDEAALDAIPETAIQAHDRLLAEANAHTKLVQRPLTNEERAILVALLQCPLGDDRRFIMALNLGQAMRPTRPTSDVQRQRILALYVANIREVEAIFDRRKRARRAIDIAPLPEESE